MTTSPNDPFEGASVELTVTSDSRWWPVAVSVGSSVLSAVLAATLCLTVSARNAEEGRDARRQMTADVCAIVVAQDDNYHDSPPTTDLGRRNAASMRQLRISLGCPDD